MPEFRGQLGDRRSPETRARQERAAKVAASPPCSTSCKCAERCTVERCARCGTCPCQNCRCRADHRPAEEPF